MTFREELEKMLRDLHGYEVPLTGEVTLDADLDYENKLVTREIETALTSIINLVDKEVIGSDLPIEQPFDDELDTVTKASWHIFRKGANWNKDNQRAIIRGNDE